MRILVYEFVSGGGFAGRPIPASLAREGRAMLNALLADLASLRQHQIVATADRRLPLKAPRGVEVVPIGPSGAALPDALVASVDAAWLVAPETGRCLERLAARFERRRTALLGPGSVAIRRASDKRRLARRLARCGVAHPTTRVLRRGADAGALARAVGYPVVVKPGRGAGCGGVCLARSASELADAIRVARRASRIGPLLLQRYVDGIAASVSLISNGRRAIALAVNAQSVRAARVFSYRGGRTPLDHPLAEQAIDASLRTCRALPGLRGYVGVDVVLTESEAVVIEVNPRLTTAYLGVRSAVGSDGRGPNIAGMALRACAGELPAPPPMRRCVRFTSGGRIVAVP